MILAVNDAEYELYLRNRLKNLNEHISVATAVLNTVMPEEYNIYFREALSFFIHMKSFVEARLNQIVEKQVDTFLGEFTFSDGESLMFTEEEALRFASDVL